MHHPVLYTLQRKDFVVSSITNNGGFIQINCSGSPEMNEGDSIYLSAGAYNSTYTITSVTSTSAVLDGVYNGSGTGFYNNLTTRSNYRLDVKIYWVNDDNIYELIATAKYYPDPTGFLKVDVAAYLRRKCKLINTCTYSEVNEAELYMGGGFTITYAENWTNSANSYNTIGATTRLYFTNSAKQLRDKYGSNMGEYVPYCDTDTVKGKFLGAFERPVYFPGFPFSLSFIFSDEIGNMNITREVQHCDINASVLESDSDAVNTTSYYALRINHLMLPSPAGDAKSFNVWLSGDNTIPPVNQYSTIGYADVESSATWSSNVTNITETSPPIE